MLKLSDSFLNSSVNITLDNNVEKSFSAVRISKPSSSSFSSSELPDSFCSAATFFSGRVVLQQKKKTTRRANGISVM